MLAVEKRYRREFWIAISAYTLVVLLILPLANQVTQTWLRALIAIAPMLPTLFVVRAILRYVLGADELVRRIHLEALAIATAVVGLVSFSLGFMVAARVLTLDGRVLLLVFPALAGAYGVARLCLQRRYAGE